MNDLASLASALVALIYLSRMNSLEWRRHEFTFVISHVLSGAGCVYSAFMLYVHGLDVLQVLTPLLAALYLFRSRDTFEETVTGPAPLECDVTNIWSRR